MPQSVRPNESTSTAALASQAFDEARELISLEVRLAKAEARAELNQLRKAAIAGGLAAALTLLALCSALIALLWALGARPEVALLVAAGLLVAGAASAVVAYRAVPKEPFDRTRSRIKDDIDRLKEHVA
jgi:uncharacterized membrane protein YqjE